MSVNAGRWRWLPIAGLAIVLVLALVFLSMKGRGHDSARYFQNVAMLRQLKQLDARWELDVLKSRIGTNSNYDPLVDPLADLTELRDRLEEVLSSPDRTAAPAALKEVSEALGHAIREKTRLIDLFKSHNAVLHNSLAFLPTAATDAHESINGIRGIDKAASALRSAELDGILLNAIVYSDSPSTEKEDEIESGLEHLLGRPRSTPAGGDERLAIFDAHVRTVLREQPFVDALLNSIAAQPTAARVDDLDALLGDEQRAVALRDQQYRLYLLTFAAALACLLVYVAIRLIRSHAVINRVNQELHGANATLEQRVEERTVELRAAQVELMTTARQAGMAEIATNVLHNVGNVLNSVNISVGLIGTRLRDSKAKGLTRAVAMIDEHAHDLGAFLTGDAKGRLLPGYLRGVSQSLQVEQTGMEEELALLGRSVDHIKDIVATQQSYAGASSISELVKIADLIDDALRMNAGSLSRHGVEVVKEMSPLREVRVDRHRLLQILVNLLSNAKHALDATPPGKHVITLRVDELLKDRIRISVSDNGEGIAPENLARIFSHGFTTRKTGHGFGLHSCVNAAQEMGGTLVAHSDGRGRGATFTLELPLIAQGDGQ